MNLGIIGIGHAFYKQVNALEKIKDINISAVCDIDSKKLEKLDFPKYNDYKKLIGICDCVLISTPPNTHFEIAEFFIKNNVNIIIEKPIVVTLNQLELLKELLNIYKIKFYNTLHFMFGNEVLWYKNNTKVELPQKIDIKIYDKYVENGHIIDEAKTLCGAYLDETINPLSAVGYLFDEKITPKAITKKYFNGDNFEYYAKSNFSLKNTDICIEVDWSKNKDDKYIDLIFKDKTIRLDSKNQTVKNITNGKILFFKNGDRMTNHYFSSFKNMLNEKDNFKKSYELHKALFGLI